MSVAAPSSFPSQLASNGNTGSSIPPIGTSSNPAKSPWADKYRGAAVEDLDPPPALSTKPSDSIADALLWAYERDYTHLTVISDNNRALLGYLSIPRLKRLLEDGHVRDNDPVSKAMQRFRRNGKAYKVIAMDTPLEDLDDFFNDGVDGSGPQEFAVVTDGSRRYVLGVVTKPDLEEFVKRRPA